METSLLIAQLLAVVYLAVAAGMLVSREYYERVLAEFRDNSFGVYLGGATSLVVGFLIVKFHNVWTAGWPVVITVIGWIAVLKGIGLLVFPEAMLKLADNYPIRVAWLFALLAGLFFAWFGFFAGGGTTTGG